MRAFVLVVLMAMAMPTKAAEAARLAVFDLEMLDTSLRGEMQGPVPTT